VRVDGFLIFYAFFFRIKKCVIECSVFFIFQTEKVQILTFEDCNIVFRFKQKSVHLIFSFIGTHFVAYIGQPRLLLTNCHE
jgi:mRNA-degrading endonuclease YafQ of YafQ-DinJ toxin-antitoxin module